MECSNCGLNIPEGTLQCWSCGTKIQEERSNDNGGMRAVSNRFEETDFNSIITGYEDSVIDES